MNRISPPFFITYFFIFFFLISLDATAVPGFARQTKLPCQSCHTIFPELTAFGREFKLNGYTLATSDQIESSKPDGILGLKIDAISPLSLMLEVSLTNLQEAIPQTQNNNVEFPQQLAIFYAGEISPHMGSFLQLTYTQQDDHFSIDNTDIRYSNQVALAGSNIIYGLTLNNNPTVEDLWNNTPAWGFPWAASDITPSQIATPLVDGQLAQSVAGLGGYVLLGGEVYANITAYRASPLGITQPLYVDGQVENVAPYWRFAWQKTLGKNYIELGTYGMYTKIIQGLSGLGAAGLADKFIDYAFDTQYERQIGSSLLSVHATYIHEKQVLDSTYPAGLSGNPVVALNTFKADATLHFWHWIGLTANYFNTKGTTDCLLYMPMPITGSRTGSPNTRGWTAQLALLPWENTQFLIQYIAYQSFNGATEDYDGFERDASGNNTLYLLAWLNW